MAHVEEVVGALFDGAQVLHEVGRGGNAAAVQKLLQPRTRAPTAHPQRLRLTHTRIPTFLSFEPCQRLWHRLCALLRLHARSNVIH